MLKKHPIKIICLAIIFLLSGCVGANNSQKTSGSESSENIVFGKTIFELKKPASLYGEYAFDSECEKVYYACVEEDKTGLYSAKIDEETFEKVGEYDGKIVNIWSDRPHELCLVTDKEDSFVIYAQNDSNLFSVEIEKIDIVNDYPLYAWMAQEGKYLVMTKESLYMFTQTGELASKTSCPGVSFQNAHCYDDGKFVVSYTDKNYKNCQAEFDSNKRAVKKMFDLGVPGLCIDADNSKEIVSDMKRAVIYNRNQDGVQLTYDFATNSIKSAYIKDVGIQDDIIFLAYENTEVGNDSVAIIKLCEREQTDNHSDEVDEEGRKIVYLYSRLGAETFMKIFGEIIEEYNFNNSNYCVRMYNGNNDYHYAIMADNPPDLIIDSSQNMLDNMTQKGYLEDEVGLFDCYCDFVSDDFESIVNKFGVQGKLYYIPVNYQIYGISVKESTLDEETVLTPEQFIEYIKKYPSFKASWNLSNAEILTICIKGNLDAYIDFKNLETHFCDSKFRNLIENIVSLQLPNENGYNLLYGAEGEIASDDIYIDLQPITNIEDISLEENILKDEIVNIGYPNEKGKRINFLTSAEYCAIPLNSSCKEGACDFINYLLTNQDEANIEEKHAHEKTCFKGRFASIDSLREKNFNGCIGTHEVKFVEGLTISFEVTDKHVDRVNRMLEDSVVESKTNRDICNIILEEFNSIINTGTSVEDACKVIDSRVYIYLHENAE